MHYYTHDGKPAHFEARGGKPTTLREARKLDLLPSVTTILNILDKPMLTNWKCEQAALKATEMLVDEPDKTWAKAVVRAAREDVMKKADAGTDIHDILEQYALGRIVQGESYGMCLEVDRVVRDATGFGLGEFVPEATVVDSALGYGGKCDLHGHGWVIDYKTKDVVADNERGYPEQAMQLAAYAHGLGMPGARLANVFIQRDGQRAVFYEHYDPLAWERFKLALWQWQVTKKFGPYFEAIKAEAA